MSSYGSLRVGPLLVSSLRNGVGNELLAVFRDDMLSVKRVPADEYYDSENEAVQSESDDADFEPSDTEYVEVVEFRAPGSHIAARLDIMGITPSVVYEYLENQLSDQSRHSEEFWPDSTTI